MGHLVMHKFAGSLDGAGAVRGGQEFDRDHVLDGLGVNAEGVVQALHFIAGPEK